MMRRLLRAWLLTGIADGTFSSVLSAFFYGSTVARLFQGVAAVPLGRQALDGGTRTALIGVAMHFSVALAWSTVFLILTLQSALLRRVLRSPWGVAKVAAIYGPCVWLVMSLVVIPAFTHRPPTINVRWWIQFFGHAVFVGLPIVASIGGASSPAIANDDTAARSATAVEATR